MSGKGQERTTDIWLLVDKENGKVYWQNCKRNKGHLYGFRTRELAREACPDYCKVIKGTFSYLVQGEET
jgi:hypothetical protein